MARQAEVQRRLLAQRRQRRNQRHLQMLAVLEVLMLGLPAAVLLLVLAQLLAHPLL